MLDLFPIFKNSVNGFFGFLFGSGTRKETGAVVTESIKLHNIPHTVRGIYFIFIRKLFSGDNSFEFMDRTPHSSIIFDMALAGRGKAADDTLLI
jgi:hypothetical protein